MADDAWGLLAQCTGFQWDAGNESKVLARHGVQPGECEQAFFVEPFVVHPDVKHSAHEQRWQALGRTIGGRHLFLVFTIRDKLIRVIAARDMNRESRRPMAKSKKNLKRIPSFESEDEEREFWAEADSSDYVDWSKARVVQFPMLRPSTTAISVRLPDPLLTELKLLANERDVPYQSLLKMYLADRVALERRRKRRRAKR